jgi:hypothetical protein
MTTTVACACSAQMGGVLVVMLLMFADAWAILAAVALSERTVADVIDLGSASTSESMAEWLIVQHSQEWPQVEMRQRCAWFQHRSGLPCQSCLQEH